VVAVNIFTNIAKGCFANIYSFENKAFFQQKLQQLPQKKQQKNKVELPVFKF
jgi:hypothetical protein